MKNTADVTVQAFPVTDSESEWVQVALRPSGDFVVRFISHGSVAQERWAFGPHKEVALASGKAWASSLRADRAWMAR
jgi:hypothetical protein